MGVMPELGDDVEEVFPVRCGVSCAAREAKAVFVVLARLSSSARVWAGCSRSRDQVGSDATITVGMKCARHCSRVGNRLTLTERG